MPPLFATTQPAAEPRPRPPAPAPEPVVKRDSTPLFCPHPLCVSEGDGEIIEVALSICLDDARRLGDSITEHLARSVRWLRRRALLETMCAAEHGAAQATVSELWSWLPWVRRGEAQLEWGYCAWQPGGSRQRELQFDTPMPQSGCGVTFASIGVPRGPDVNFSTTFGPIEARTHGSHGGEILLFNLGAWFNCLQDSCARDAEAVLAALRSTTATTSGTVNSGGERSQSWNQRAIARLNAAKLFDNASVTFELLPDREYGSTAAYAHSLLRLSDYIAANRAQLPDHIFWIAPTPQHFATPSGENRNGARVLRQPSSFSRLGNWKICHMMI